MKSPSFSQWKKISKVLHKKERVVFFSLLTIALGSLLFMGISLYLKNTKVVPARGGRLIEGAVGQPRFLNPIYGETNDIDRDLTELVFSGLMTYSNQGELVGDMVKEYEISQDGRTY
ncbi:hypothetical protein KKG36_00745, partial [Patescibacteria group bacterium]|nr:hypothetical protein [Patescibacteria group bacterium]